MMAMRIGGFTRFHRRDRRHEPDGAALGVDHDEVVDLVGFEKAKGIHAKRIGQLVLELRVMNVATGRENPGR